MGRGRRAHRLKPLKGGGTPSYMVWTDTEAANEHGKPEAGRQRLTFGVAEYREYSQTRYAKLEKQERIRYTKAATFWEWVSGKARPKTVLWVMAHNWGYDGGILDTTTCLEGLGWECTRWINEGRPPIIIHYRKNGCTLKLIDTLNYFRTSVSSLGKSLGTPKLPMPPHDAPKSDWDAYAWRDCDIIRDAFLALRDLVKEGEYGPFQPTLASQAMAAYKARFMSVQPVVHDRWKYLELERMAYHGGRTESFYRGEYHGTIYKLDFNSLYPTIMRNERLSFRPYTYHATPVLPDVRKALDMGLGVVADVTVDTDVPAYAYYDGVRLIFPVGEFDCALSTPELVYALEHGHITSVRRFCTYQMDYLFREYVDHFYTARQEYQKEGNDAFQYMVKIMMNSLYGKFGQRGRRWEESEIDWSDNHVGLYQERPGEPVVKVRNRAGISQELKYESESENSIPIIATEICAHGRMMLWRAIEEVTKSGGQCFYSDTDSLVVDKVGLESLKGNIGSQLGQLKNEGEADYGCFMAPKDYTFGDEAKIKGVRTAQRGVREYVQAQFRSWDAHLGRNESGFIDVSDIKKVISGLNQKRVVSVDTGWTAPIKLVK